MSFVCFRIPFQFLNLSVPLFCILKSDPRVFTKKEKKELVTICHRFTTLKHSSVLPYAFTEHGVAMLASVLRSERAVKISIIIIKTFVRLRRIIVTHKELGLKLSQLEGKIEKHDTEIKTIFEAIRQLMTPPEKTKRRIGFKKN